MRWRVRDAVRDRAGGSVAAVATKSARALVFGDEGAELESAEVCVSILIVEDTTVAAKLLELHIKNLGYEAVTTTSGEAAIQALEAHPDIELVITDIMMPGMDGFALIRTINEHQQWRRLPIIVATALSDVLNAKQVVQLGVQHYLVKPVDKAQLMRTIRAALAEREPTLISKQEVIQRLDLDPAMYASLATSFAELADESIRLLAEPREPGCVPGGLALNGLYEAATMFGVQRLQRVSRKLLEQPTPAAVPSATEIELERLADDLRAVVSSLRREETADPAPATAPDSGSSESMAS